VTGAPRLAVTAGAIAILAAGVAGCTSSGNTGAKPAASSAQAPVSPRNALQLAAVSARTENSATATMNLHLVANGGASGGAADTTMAGTIQTRLHPSIYLRADFSAFKVNGQSLGEVSEIVTPKALYLKMPLLTQSLHTNKPWVEMSMSSLSSSSGANLGSLFSQLQSSSPATQAQILAAATNVRKVGTSTVDGVAVTEYSGSVPMTAALRSLPADLRTQMSQQIEQLGIGSVEFKEWIDGQNQMRKAIITEVGSQLTETISMTVTSINQRVNAQVPPSSQATVIPASALGGAG
jgi:hypothetical protein